MSLKYAIEHIDRALTTQKKDHQKFIEHTQSRFLDLEKKSIIRLFHSDTPEAIGIWSFIVINKHSNDIAEALDEYGICVRSGHHCCDPLHQSW
jgi:cysteine desulfurase/selenocysteine lyase